MRLNEDLAKFGWINRTNAAKISTLRAGALADLRVEFTYDDLPRTVEVHAVGRSTKDGSLVLRGYQTGGESSRDDLPQWKLFTVDKIRSLTITLENSQAPREGYVQSDKQMGEILTEIAL